MSDFTTPRVSEKKFYTIPDVAMTANGTVDGIITIPSTYQYKVGMVISLFSTTQTPRRLKIKRVISKTQMHVGDEKTPINSYVDISAFTIADTATVRYTEQQRPVIDINEINRQVYEEEPTVALRNHLVDYLGRSYDKTNPIPVELTDGSISIGTVNAELEVALNHKDGDPDSGDVADSVRIGDGEDELQINPDGSINANPVPSNPDAYRIKSEYNEVIAVPTSSATVVQTFTAPVGVITYLQKIFFSGTNVATYEIKLNGVVLDKKRTYFGAALDGMFDFSDGSRGRLLDEGDVVEVITTHIRPNVGDFNSRIQIIEV